VGGLSFSGFRVVVCFSGFLILVLVADLGAV